MTPTITSFNDLSLPAPIAKALETMKFTAPTPIQAAAIPIAMQKRDIIACAQTGTGKTVAFSVPLIAKILENPNSRALVVTPTRELAVQVADVILKLTDFCQQINVTAVIGGASMNRQMRELRKDPQVIIGTPGRLVDHMNRRSIDFKKIDALVLDEADRMFDMGFADSMEQIFKAIANDRQTFLFSATMSPEVTKLATSRMRNPERVSIGSIDRPIAKIKQVRVDVQGKDKNPKILEEIEARAGQILVFVRTKQRTDRLAKYLKENKVKTASIHGGRTQSQREQALEAFRSGGYRVLCATDVASRGLDIPDIGTVFNFDLPETAEDYIHRIGRTARAGAEGEAVSFVTPEENRHWNYLVKAKDGQKMEFQRGGKQQSRGRSGGGYGSRGGRSRDEGKPGGFRRGGGKFRSFDSRPEGAKRFDGAQSSFGSRRPEGGPRPERDAEGRVLGAGPEIRFDGGPRRFDGPRKPYGARRPQGGGFSRGPRQAGGFRSDGPRSDGGQRPEGGQRFGRGPRTGGAPSGGPKKFFKFIGKKFGKKPSNGYALNDRKVEG